MDLVIAWNIRREIELAFLGSLCRRPDVNEVYGLICRLKLLEELCWSDTLEMRSCFVQDLGNAFGAGGGGVQMLMALAGSAG